MRILSVHNHYKIRGGEDECFEAEAQLLREYGHDVYEYTENNNRLEALSSFATATKTIWSQAAYRQIKHQLQNYPVDVVHVHNFLPLISPAVFYAAKSAGVPVVQTLHNYRLLCPNALFFRDGSICTDCLGKAIPWPGIQHGCYRQSRAASGGIAAMLSLHRALHTWQQQVDGYIALTDFARQQFIQGGLPADRVFVKPNFVNPDPGVGNGKGGYALYVGRLSVEKGLDTLLAAWEELDAKLPLKIVGDGPLADLVTEAIRRLPHVEWLGRKPMAEVHALMGEALCLVFPSKWYETFGRVAIESFAKGTPVVASNIGAIAEVVKPGHTGLHFQPGNAADLARTVKGLLANPPLLRVMRQRARAEFERKYTPKRNHKQLIHIYQRIRTEYESPLAQSMTPGRP